MRLLIKKFLKAFYRLFCSIRSILYSRLIDEGGGRIMFSNLFLKTRIVKSKGSSLVIKGRLKICPYLGGISPARIILGENAKFIINGDFNIGNGVCITVSKNATLIIGGKESETESGITADTIILVYNKITIGKDFVCAWDVFISDSDWHNIDGQPHHKDIKIGDHVWIANKSSILKGSVIGNNSIIASHSKVINKSFPDSVLIGGVPAKILKENTNWSRDLV